MNPAIQTDLWKESSVLAVGRRRSFLQNRVLCGSITYVHPMKNHHWSRTIAYDSGEQLVCDDYNITYSRQETIVCDAYSYRIRVSLKHCVWCLNISHTFIPNALCVIPRHSAYVSLERTVCKYSIVAHGCHYSSVWDRLPHLTRFR